MFIALVLPTAFSVIGIVVGLFVAFLCALIGLRELGFGEFLARQVRYCYEQLQAYRESGGFVPEWLMASQPMVEDASVLAVATDAGNAPHHEPAQTQKSSQPAQKKNRAPAPVTSSSSSISRLNRVMVGIVISLGVTLLASGLFWLRAHPQSADAPTVAVWLFRLDLSMGVFALIGNLFISRYVNTVNKKVDRVLGAFAKNASQSRRDDMERFRKRLIGGLPLLSYLLTALLFVCLGVMVYLKIFFHATLWPGSIL